MLHQIMNGLICQYQVLFEDLIEKLLLISKAEKVIPSKEMKIKFKINSNGELATQKIIII